jgi:hypothetical protein
VQCSCVSIEDGFWVGLVFSQQFKAGACWYTRRTRPWEILVIISENWNGVVC